MCPQGMLLVLALVSAQAGCAELFCPNSVIKDTAWVGDTILEPRISAAGDTVLALWRHHGGANVYTAGIVGFNVTNRGVAAEVDTVRGIASAPTGHLLLVGDDSLSARVFDANGVVTTSHVEVSGGQVVAPSAVFDGTHFLIAWTEGNALKLSSLPPGGETASAPITIRDDLASGQRIVMASSGGLTWITWAQEGRVLGLRVTRDGAIDPTPLVLLQDTWDPAGRTPRLALASSNGRFLLAVEQEAFEMVLVFFDGQGNLGTTLEIADPMSGTYWSMPFKTLVGEPSGFAFLRRGPSGEESVVRLSHDGSDLRENRYTIEGVRLASDDTGGVGLASDDTGLLFASVHFSAVEDDGESVFKLMAIDGDGRLEIASTELHRETYGSSCPEPSY